MPSTSPPEISVQELSERLRSGDSFVLLDVRETWEVKKAAIQDARLEVRPLSALAREGTQGLPPAAQWPDAEIYVLCHQGIRSASVAGWLVSQGWTRIFSVAGGIDAYATQIDSSVGLY